MWTPLLPEVLLWRTEGQHGSVEVCDKVSVQVLLSDLFSAISGGPAAGSGWGHSTAEHRLQEAEAGKQLWVQTHQLCLRGQRVGATRAGPFDHLTEM